MADKIHWRSIPNLNDVIDEGSHYSYHGKTVFWTGSEKFDAVKILSKHAKSKDLFGAGLMGV